MTKILKIVTHEIATIINKFDRYHHMSLFREGFESSNLETLKNACPICHSDVKGNDEFLYYCQKCNILYRKVDLVLDKKVVDDLLKQKVAEKFSKDKEKIQISQPLVQEKVITEKKAEILEDLKKSKKYYISRKSNIVHMSNCQYGKNIKKENKIILKSLDGTEKLKKCKCMTEQ